MFAITDFQQLSTFSLQTKHLLRNYVKVVTILTSTLYIAECGLLVAEN